MIEKIFKYEIPLMQGPFDIELPQGAEILFIELQHGKPTLWCKFTPGERIEIRQFIGVATGEDYNPKGLRYIGSLLYGDGVLIYHYFEKLT